MNTSTIGLIIDLLRVSDFYNESELIDIAKGKYQIPRTFKQMKNVIQRNNKDYGKNWNNSN